MKSRLYRLIGRRNTFFIFIILVVYVVSMGAFAAIYSFDNNQLEKGVANYQLSQEFNIARETISKYLDEIYATIPKEDLKKVYVDFTKLFDRLFREANKMLSQSTTRTDKEKTMRLILQLLKEKTDFLERFFVKRKAEENININADITQKQVVINYNVPNGSITD